MLADRTADTLETWLRTHPGVQMVCRDGSATYAGAIRRTLPEAMQVADRWHLWHNLAEAVLKEAQLDGTSLMSRVWAEIIYEWDRFGGVTCRLSMP